LSDIKQSLMPETPYEGLKKLWEEGWSSLERVCRNAAHLAHIWKHGTKNLRKRRALSNLLKILEESGLSRHRSVLNEVLAIFSFSIFQGSTWKFLASISFVKQLCADLTCNSVQIAEMTNVLAQIFILVFSKGFGSAEEEIETTTGNGSEDASGTGMGEGEGINDVSDQIEDEAQLLGSSEKVASNNCAVNFQQEGQDKLDKVPNDKDKGIEMEEDFDAETFSMNGDSDDTDSEDEEDLNLDSRMGQTADGDQVVDEKPWDRDEDGNTENLTEKYESGPAVKKTDSTSRELRAKDDNALAKEDSEEMDRDESDRLTEENKESEKCDDDLNADDMMLDKNQAFEDSTGTQFQEQARDFEDVDMDELQGSDVIDGAISESSESDEEMKDDEKSKQTDVDDSCNQVDENSQKKEGEEEAEIANMDLESNKETLESDKIEPLEYPADGTESFKSASNSHGVDFTMDSEISWANSTDMNSSIAPSKSLPSDEVPKMEITIPNSVDGSGVSYDQFQSKPENSQDSNLSMQRTRTNPYRSLGDAMEDWKERAKVSVDTQEHQSELVEDLAGENAEEYEFVSEAEKSTSQALAAATSDQIKDDFKGSKFSRDESHNLKNEDNDRSDVMESSETSNLKPTQALIPREKVDEIPNMAVEGDTSAEEMEQRNLHNLYEDMVSFKSSYMYEKVLPLYSSPDDKVLSRSLGIESVSDEALQKAISEWKRYEVVTTRLSQELAEQLRLVMEPTLASKLQGDYKTGKRINMKKVNNCILTILGRSSYSSLTP
ncbi:hypothetical protein BHE74_00041923, partial [Ensete ventricosum]